MGATNDANQVTATAPAPARGKAIPILGLNPLLLAA